jgi:4-oxalocrotonate tautomerase
VSINNQEAVRKVAEAYITATFEGDVEALRRLFDESAIMYGYLNGELLKAGAEPFFEQMAGTPSLKSSGAPYDAAVDLVDASDNIGTAIITEKCFGPFEFTNYLHLLKENDEWKIISKTFESSLA